MLLSNKNKDACSMRYNSTMLFPTHNKTLLLLCNT